MGKRAAVFFGLLRMGTWPTQVTRLGMAEIELTYPRDGIALVTMNRPDKLNAMTSTMVEALHDTFTFIGRSRDVRVAVLTGEGRGFCAGLDLGGYGCCLGVAIQPVACLDGGCLRAYRYLPLRIVFGNTCRHVVNGRSTCQSGRHAAKSSSIASFGQGRYRHF